MEFLDPSFSLMSVNTNMLTTIGLAIAFGWLLRQYGVGAKSKAAAAADAVAKSVQAEAPAVVSMVKSEKAKLLAAMEAELEEVAVAAMKQRVTSSTAKVQS